MAPLSCVLLLTAVTAAAAYLSLTGDGTVTIDTIAPLTVGPDTIPAAAVSLFIRGPSHLTLATNATGRLTLLRSVTIESVGRLTVESSALQPARTSTGAPLSVSISDADWVQLRSGAVSGRWSDPGQLRLANISRLEVAGGALAAPLSLVSLHGVQLPVCEPGTFWSDVRRLSITSSRLDRLQPHCVQLAGGGQLLLRDTRVAALLPRAISGRLQRIAVSGGALGWVASRAVQGSVGQLRWENCSVDRLENAALDVTVQRAALVQVRVGEAADGALAGLRDTAHLVIDTVSVLNAKPGALRLDKTVRRAGLRMTRVFLDGLVCDCDMAAAARRLAGAELADRLLTAAFCTTPGESQALVRLSEVRCGSPVAAAAADTPSARPPLASAAGGDDQTVVFYVVVCGAVGLLAVLLYLAARHRQRIAALLRLLGCLPAGRRPHGRRPPYSTQSSNSSRVHLTSQRTG